MTRISIRRPMRTLTALAVGIAAACNISYAGAAVITTVANADFSDMPASISLGDGSYTFSAIPDAFIGTPTAAVTTGGTDLVSSFGGGVADFQTGATIDQTDQLYGFSSFPATAVIPNSAAQDFIGLEFALSDGQHFGYAEVAGTTLIGYAYETVAGVGIVTHTVPEPASMLLLGAGLAGLASVRWRAGRGLVVTQPVATTAD